MLGRWSVGGAVGQNHRRQQPEIQRPETSEPTSVVETPVVESTISLEQALQTGDWVNRGMGKPGNGNRPPARSGPIDS